MIDFKNSEHIFDTIQNTKWANLKDDLIKKAIRYAHIRAEWQFISLEEKNENEADRTAAHNAFIDSCNILSRNMAKSGEDINWRTALTNDRKVIGDFACFIHALIGIRNR